MAGVADGDTLTVLDANHQQHKIRLSGIDAPEKAQAFGERSKQSLAAQAFNKNEKVEWNKQDRYGRIVGKILVDGVDVSSNCTGLCVFRWIAMARDSTWFPCVMSRTVG